MIICKRRKMNEIEINISGNAEDVACEYAALTEKLLEIAPQVLERVQLYFEHMEVDKK